MLSCSLLPAAPTLRARLACESPQDSTGRPAAGEGHAERASRQSRTVWLSFNSDRVLCFPPLRATAVVDPKHLLVT